MSISVFWGRVDDVAHFVGDEVVSLHVLLEKKKSLKSHGSPIHAAFLWAFVIPGVQLSAGYWFKSGRPLPSYIKTRLVAQGWLLCFLHTFLKKSKGIIFSKLSLDTPQSKKEKNNNVTVIVNA